jgi:HlyD family secretion protein
MKINLSKRKIFILAGVIIILSAAMVFTYLNSGETVDTEIASTGELVQLVTDNGVVEAEGTITLTAKVSMEITKVFANEGDFVDKGDIILSNNDSSANLDIDSLKAQASGVAAQTSNANSIAKNSKILLEEGAMSQAEYNAVQATASQLNSQLASLNYSIQSYKQGSGVGGLISPISGYITELYAKEGETVSPGLNIVEISPLETYYITLNLIPEDAMKVQVGNPVTIKQNEIILSNECKVERISKKAKEIISDIGIGQKRVEIRIAVPKDITGLLLGNNVDVEIQSALLKNVLRVSTKAIFEKDGFQYVYTIEDDKAKLTKIETGIKGDNFTEITNGIEEGDVVILSPSNKITDGVQTKPSPL